MASSKVHLKIILFLPVLAGLALGEPAKHSLPAVVCRMLNEKFTISSPWTNQPIIYEPIQRGRLTIWTGATTLTTSEFRCSEAVIESTASDRNMSTSSSAIMLEFSSYAHKLDWTFFNSNKGSTHVGTSVKHCDNDKFKITILNKHHESYLECNVIDKIEPWNEEDASESLQSSCQDCSQPILNFVDNQMKEIFRTKLNEQVMDNLYWQLTQLISSQHFTTPLNLKHNLD